MKLLLISNSTNSGENYLAHPKNKKKHFLGQKKRQPVFIPYAAVTFSFAEYEKKVNEAFADIGHHVIGIHRFDHPAEAIENADAIVVGGGNTWHLVKMLQDNKLIEAIRKKAKEGTPYIGWSAGANIACPTLKTTNDMPIVEPAKFETLGLIPFQINPHYTDEHPTNFSGETREVRINEFIEVNKNVFVVGLREGTMLLREDNALTLIGNRNARIFKYGESPRELSYEDDFTFLLSESE
ncbi:MAG: dipeptidase PepE [Dysgonamonadaceae bacterium]